MAFTDVADSADIRDDAPFVTRVGDRKLLLARVDGEVRAIENRCPHLGLSMTRGKIANGAISCPWHGSSFDLCTGENRDWINSVAGMSVPQWTRTLIAFGKKPAPVETFSTREERGRVFVEI